MSPRIKVVHSGSGGSNTVSSGVITNGSESELGEFAVDVHRGEAGACASRGEEEGAKPNRSAMSASARRGLLDGGAGEADEAGRGKTEVLDKAKYGGVGKDRASARARGWS